MGDEGIQRMICGLVRGVGVSGLGFVHQGFRVRAKDSRVTGVPCSQELQGLQGYFAHKKFSGYRGTSLIGGAGFL